MSNATSAVRCRCPVCGAAQDWSAQCRRCAADLTLLWEVADAANSVRRSCLLALVQSKHDEALALAKRLVRLRSDAPERRLLAVCHLMCEDYAAAASLAK